MRLTNFIRVVAFAVGAATVTVAQAADISGAGATFPFPIYAKWADSYKKDTGNGLNYQSIGSGAGIKQIKARTVTFGATDAPLEPKELDKAGLAQWPMVMGGIVAVVNLPGVKPGDKSWPMTAATFILLPKDPPNKAAAKDAIDFFKWAYEKGDKMAEDLDYIPMPDSVVALVQKMWASDIKQ